jgi:polyhydroxyalkanoate synthase
MAYWNEAMTNPARLLEHQVEYWGKTLTHFLEMQQNLSHGQFVAPADDPGLPEDKRFANPLWKTHPYFNFVKHQYLLGAKAIEDAVAGLEGLDETDKARVEFFANQMIDLFSPTNYLATNPDALERAVETEGMSLVQGLENMVRDIESHHGELLPTLADPAAFEVGGNIATAEGSVVYRNRMMELIQYAPTTETVHRTPLVIFPPWINKFYIMDLKPQNSLIRWIVDQGYTLFVVSWKNPDASYADVGLEQYVEEGYLEAVRVAREITGEKQVNAIGYCIAGTTLSAVLALSEEARGEADQVGDLLHHADRFLRPGGVHGLPAGRFRRRHRTTGGGRGPAGQLLHVQDVLLPARQGPRLWPRRAQLHDGRGAAGLRPALLERRFHEPAGPHGGAVPARSLPGQPVERGHAGAVRRNAVVADVDVPVYAIACETDHIAAWKDSFRGVAKMGSKNKTFVLSESGHIAGIVNPPSKKKYGHYTNEDVSGTPEEWLAGADYNEGSWWPRWEKWLSSRSGKQVPARIPGEAGYDVLAPAPGTYVLEKTNG